MNQKTQINSEEELVRIFVSRLQSVRDVRDTVQAFVSTSGGWLELYAKKEIVLLRTLYNLHYASPRPVPLPDYFGRRFTDARTFYLLHYARAKELNTGWWYVRENGINKKLDLRTRREIKESEHVGQLSFLFDETSNNRGAEVPTFKSTNLLDKIRNKYEELSIKMLREFSLKKLTFSIRGEEVFISYSHKDAGIVEQFEKMLTSHQISVWRDKHRIHGGDSVWREIHGAIESAKVGVVFWSPFAEKSEPVKRELDAMMYKRHQEPNFVILPVLLGGQGAPSLLKEPVFREEVEMAYIEESPETNLIETLLRVTKLHLGRNLEA